MNTGTITSDFGRYLQTIEERDIDLLLMEEFHVSPTFVAWFAEQAALDGKAGAFAGAWHSLSEEYGETDLLLRLQVGNERLALLIENKIAAPEQNQQDIRYHIRGVRGREAGRYERFATCICAPQVYLDGLPPTSAYEHRVAYEAIRDWFAGVDGARAAWRKHIMEEAIEQGRRGYVMVVSGIKTAFHLSYWEHLQRRHPALLMRKPGDKGPKSDWMMIRGIGMPPKVTLIHKNDQGYMDLQFEKTAAPALAARRETWPEEIRIVQRNNAAALSIPVPKCDMAAGFETQVGQVEEALAAAYRLLPFADVMQT